MQGKRVLITSTDLMMVQFLLPHVSNLTRHGFEVEVACSEVGGRLDEVKNKLNGIVKAVHSVRLKRSPFSLSNYHGYNDLRQLLLGTNYDIIWTNEPVMGIVTRLAARKARQQGTKVLYMAHGFHFFKGAPMLNWILFYPIERIMARHADLIVTVNREDFCRAQTFPVKRVEYIHGIGMNSERLNLGEGNIRKELNLTENDIIVVSVGELNKNKNQQVIIKSLAQIGSKALHYVLCGKGDEEQNLRELAGKKGLQDKVHFLGYRRDIADICGNSDIYVMPSRREGLPMSTLEAMYLGLPVVTSRIRGLTDIVKDTENGFLNSPNYVDGFAKGIATLAADKQLCQRMGKKNREIVIPFLIENTKEEVLRLIQSL